MTEELRLPNAKSVVIDPAKLHDYLLSRIHYSERFKAAFFESLGYVRDDEDSPRFVTAYPGGECMRFKLLDTVVLTKDHKEFGLKRGDLGTVVEVNEPGSFEVEFLRASGKPEALVTLTPDDLRPVSDSDVLSVRPFTEQSA